MAYTPLVLDPSTPEPIQAFVAERIEPLLRQVRALLALPVTPEAAGVELVVAPALFSVLGGLSQVFFKDGSSTERVAIDYPIGHRKRRAEGIPVLLRKYESALRGHFPRRQVESILAASADSVKFDQMPIDTFMTLFIV